MKGLFLDCDGCALGDENNLNCGPCPIGMVCQGPDGYPLAMMTDEGNGILTHRQPYIPAGFMAIAKNTYVCAGKGSACPGAFMNSDFEQMCAEGGQGVACSSCLDGKRFDGERCVKCEGSAGVGIVVLFVLGIIAFIVFTMSTFGKEPEGQYNHFSVLRRQHAATAAATWSMVLTLVQTTWIISKLSTKLPITVKNIFATTGGVFDMTAFRISCGLALEPTELAVTKTAVLNAAPAGVLLASSVIFVMARYFPRPTSLRWPRVPELMSSVLAIFLLFFMAIADCAINTGMSVITHPCGHVSLRAYPFILETDPEAVSIRVIAIVGTVLWCIGGLAIMIFILAQFKKYAENLVFRRATLAISIRYKNNMPWWTLVVLIQNLLVALALTLFESGAWQSIYLAFVLAIYFALVSAFRPFFAPVVHCCELGSSLGRVLLMMVAPIYSETQEGDWLVACVVFLTYGSVAFFFVYTIYLVIRFRFSDEPDDLEQECIGLEERLTNKIMGTVPDYVDVAQQASGTDFVWHDKLPQVSKHSSGRASGRASRRDSFSGQQDCAAPESAQPSPALPTVEADEIFFAVEEREI